MINRNEHWLDSEQVNQRANNCTNCKNRKRERICFGVCSVTVVVSWSSCRFFSLFVHFYHDFVFIIIVIIIIIFEKHVVLINKYSVRCVCCGVCRFLSSLCRESARDKVLKAISHTSSFLDYRREWWCIIVVVSDHSLWMLVILHRYGPTCVCAFVCVGDFFA